MIDPTALATIRSVSPDMIAKQILEATQIEHQFALGWLGETIAKTCLETRGHTVEFSSDRKDPFKDIIMDGTYELQVKTQVPWFARNSFTINQKSYAKYMTIHGFVFISVPHKTISDFHHEGNIYAYDMPVIEGIIKGPYTVNDRGSKRQVYTIPRLPKQVIGNVKDLPLGNELFNKLRNFSTSTYTG